MSFNFDFPKFGSLPGSNLLGNQSVTPPLSNASPTTSQHGYLSRQSSEGRSMSPNTGSSMSRSRAPSQPSNLNAPAELAVAGFSSSDNMHGFASTLPQMGRSANDPFGDLFSPSILKTVKQDAGYFNPADSAQQGSANAPLVNNGGDSTAGIPDHRVFRFNSNSIASDSASPSASSSSQWNQNVATSSCGTSPEPISDSPANASKSPQNTQGNTVSQYSFTQLPSQGTESNLDMNNDFSVPQLDTFDPVLFGDYRDATDNILGSGNFTGGFFDDGLNNPPLDLGSPSNLFGILTNSTLASNTNATVQAPSQSLMAEIDKAREGDYDFTTPTTDTKVPAVPKKITGTQPDSKLISCTNIW